MRTAVAIAAGLGVDEHAGAVGEQFDGWETVCHNGNAGGTLRRAPRR